MTTSDTSDCGPQDTNAHLGYPFDVGEGGRDKINRRDIGQRGSIRMQLNVKSNAHVSQVLHSKDCRQHIFG